VGLHVQTRAPRLTRVPARYKNHGASPKSTQRGRGNGNATLIPRALDVKTSVRLLARTRTGKPNPEKAYRDAARFTKKTGLRPAAEDRQRGGWTPDACGHHGALVDMRLERRRTFGARLSCYRRPAARTWAARALRRLGCRPLPPWAIEPDDVADLLDELRSLESFRVSWRCGWSRNAFQMRSTADCVRPTSRAIERVDQCVASLGVVSSVLTISSSTCSSLIVRPPRPRLVEHPSKRCSAKRATSWSRCASAWALERRRVHASNRERS
jgi:hypothetical protein